MRPALFGVIPEERRSQAIPCSLWNPTVHYPIHKRPKPTNGQDVFKQVNTNSNTVTLTFLTEKLKVLFAVLKTLAIRIRTEPETLPKYVQNALTHTVNAGNSTE